MKKQLVLDYEAKDVTLNRVAIVAPNGAQYFTAKRAWLREDNQIEMEYYVVDINTKSVTGISTIILEKWRLCFLNEAGQIIHEQTN